MKNNDTGFKVIAVVALLIAVVGLSIAYAGYTATLKVEGTATVSSAWKIKWTDLDSGTATGYATLPATTDTNKFAINTSDSLTVSGFVGTLKAPGDTIKYTWKVSNLGQIDAELTGVVLGSITCAPAATNGSTAEEAAAVCSMLSVDFTYDGATLETSTTGYLLKDESKTVTMTLSCANEEVTELSGDVAITIGETTFTYTQKATA